MKDLITDTHNLDKFIQDGLSFKRNRDGHFVTSIAYHQYVMLQNLGYIPRGQCIHHKDFDYDNNNFENLQILTFSEHAKVHKKTDLQEKKCVCCGKIFMGIRNKRIKYCSKTCANKTFEKKYFSKYPEKLASKKYRYYLNRKEHVSEVHKEWYKKNKDKIKERKLFRKAQNPPK